MVTLINLGMRRTGLTPGTEDERDLDQVRLAIDAIRAQLPLLEQSSAPQTAPIRDALSQLQLAFVRLGGAAGPGGGQLSAGEATRSRWPGGPADQVSGDQGPANRRPVSGGSGDQAAGAPGGPGAPRSPPSKPGEPGPAQRSGRLWVPGQ